MRRLTIYVLISCLLMGCHRQFGDGSADVEAPPSIAPPNTATQPDNSRPISGSFQSVKVDQKFELQRLAELVHVHKFEEARAYLKPQLIDQPRDYELLFWAARIEESSGQIDAAIELLDEIPEQDPKFGLIALGQTADLLLRRNRFNQAIDRYERIVETKPQIAIAHRQLASLYNRLGRRQLAIPHLQSLLRIGDVTQEELAALLCQRDAASTMPLSVPGSDSSIAVLQWLDSVAQARELATQGDLQQSLRLLKELLGETKDSSSQDPDKRPTPDPSSVALLGRVAAELQDPEGIALWCSLVDDQQKQFAEYWFALGSLSLLIGNAEKPESTVAMLCQSVLLDPTDWVAFGLLENQMNRIGETEKEQAFQDRAMWIKRSILAGNEIAERGIDSTNAIERLTEALRQLDRPLESNTWQIIAASSSIKSKHASLLDLTELQKNYKKLVESGNGFAGSDKILCGLELPSNLAPIHDEWLARIKLHYDPTLVKTASRSLPEAETEPSHVIRWVKREQEVGLNFSYLNSNPLRVRDFQLYEQFGGAVAALDYDRDGGVDFYFVQSAGEPLKKVGAHPNRLFAQRRGTFDDVTSESGVGDRGYGLGVTVGDVNQDGFDDILIGNYGRNVLYINQGDGTFIEPQLGIIWDATGWTAAVAIADLNNDGLPDIFEANYIDDERVLNRPQEGPDGRLSHFPGPEDFRSAADRLLVQSVDGQWSDCELEPASVSGPGLGILIANIDQQSSTNEVFVANDTRPNSFWQFQDEKWWDVAKLKGCAYSARGGSGASMGIAAADFDNNGQLDIHVTNFYNEPVHHYMQDHHGVFVDKVIPAGLYNDSMAVLGFGTVAVDIENDGDSDIVTVNGHIEDLRFRGAPFQMKPQLFLNRDGRFTLQSSNNESGMNDFFDRETLGRGLIRTDWNADGRIDLVVTHLDQPANLVENATTSTDHWIQLECIGTRSERTAIGAIITVQTTLGETKHWLTSGGGYGCQDERMIHVGLGKAEKIESVNVQWPSGSQQRFQCQQIDSRMLLIENETLPYATSL